MKEMVLSLIINQTYFLSAVCAVAFRVRLRKMCELTVSFLRGAWNAAWSLVYLVFASFVAVVTAAGSIGGYALGEYAVEHIHPVVCILLLEFALFLIFLFNYYIVNNIKFKNHICLYAARFFERVREAAVIFRRPRFILLQ